VEGVTRSPEKETGRAVYRAGSGTGYTLIFFRSPVRLSNLTTPATLAKRV
jgi:hypothetical protein